MAVMKQLFVIAIGLILLPIYVFGFLTGIAYAYFYGAFTHGVVFVPNLCEKSKEKNEQAR